MFLFYHCEILFNGRGGFIGIRGVLETLTPRSRVHADVIDIWAMMLNDKEKHHGKDRKPMAFMNTGILVSSMSYKVSNWIILINYFL